MQRYTLRHLVQKIKAAGCTFLELTATPRTYLPAKFRDSVLIPAWLLVLEVMLSILHHAKSFMMMIIRIMIGLFCTQK